MSHLFYNDDDDNANKILINNTFLPTQVIMSRKHEFGFHKGYSLAHLLLLTYILTYDKADFVSLNANAIPPESRNNNRKQKIRLSEYRCYSVLTAL